MRLLQQGAHGSRRSGLIAAALIGNTAATATSFAYMIVSAGVFYRTLDAELFGAWALFVSLLPALSFLDLGIGNAALGQVATTLRASGASGAASIIKAAIGSAAVIAAAVFGIGLLLHLALPLRAIFPETKSIDQIDRALIPFAALLSTNIVTSIMGQCARGLQRATHYNTGRIVGFAFATISTIACAKLGASLSVILLATYAPQLLCAAVFYGMAIYRTVGDEIFASGFRERRVDLGFGLVRTGRPFLVLQISTALGLLFDFLIASSLLGLTAAAGLAIVQRLFQPVTVGTQVLNGALWPTYALLSGPDDGKERTRLFRIAVGCTAVAAAALSGALFASREFLAHLWLGSIPVGLTLTFALAGLWVVAEAVGSSASVYMNATGRANQQAAGALVYGLGAFGLKLLLVPMFGLPAIYIATLCAYGVGNAIIYSSYGFRSLQQTRLII